MRVLFVDQFSDLGGAQLILRDILAEAKRRAWHVELMAPGDGALMGYCRENDIPTHRLSMGEYSNASKRIRDVLRYGPDMARTAWGVRSIVSRRGIGLVFANGPRILPAVSIAGCPVALHLHSRLEKSYARAVAAWSLPQGAHVIAVCNSVAQTLTSHAVRVIYNGVADQGYVTRGSRGRRMRVGIIGRIAPNKGQEDFVRVAQLLASSSASGARFTIHGATLFADPSYEKKIREMARGVPVEFHGWSNNVPQLLREIDILAVPSAGIEATPRVIMEAMSAGTPVVAYPSGGIPELITNGVTGVLTERADFQALAGSIASLLGNPGLMSELARNGRREWETRFRVERFQKDVCDLLETCAKEGSQAESAAAIA